MGMSSDTRNKPLVNLIDEGAFEAVFTRYYPLVYRLAFRCAGRLDEAEDIAQEVFLRFYRMPPRATSEGEQRAWLCKVATNLSLNALRTRQRRTLHEEQAGEIKRQEMSGDAAHSSPEQQVIAAEQAAITRAMLAELPERQQTYLLLRSVGLSYAEIAQATGVAQASVGALLSRAEREFRRRYHERATASKE